MIRAAALFIRIDRSKTCMFLIERARSPEVQGLLKTYIASLKRGEGSLFPGYKNKPINPQLCNDIFQQLCEAAGIKDNEKRLSFHCCRMWFSAQLRNKVSDDLIDLCTGHNVRFVGAYLGDLQKTREVLLEAGVVDILRLQQVTTKNGVISTLRSEVDELREMVSILLGVQTTRMSFEEVKKVAERNKRLITKLKEAGFVKEP